MTQIFQQYTINYPSGGQQPTQVVYSAAGGSVLLYNTSQSVTINLSASPTLNTDVTPLAPLSSVVFDGSSDIYAVTTASGLIAVVDSYPSALTFNPSIQPSSLLPAGVAAPITVASGPQNLFPAPQPVGQYNSYDININAHCTNQVIAGGNLTLSVQLVWSEDAAGQVISYVEQWEFWISSSRLTIPNTTGSGPCHGAYLQVILAANQEANIIIDTLTLFGSARTIGRSDWRQTLGVANATISSGTTMENPNDSAYEAVLCNLTRNQAIGANASFFIPLGLFSGKISVEVNYSQALAANFIIGAADNLTNGAPTAGTSAPGAIWNSTGATGTYRQDGIAAPQCPLYAYIRNGGTAAAFNLVVTGSFA